MKRRKKQNTIQQKQDTRHQEKLFFDKLFRIMAELGDASARGMLPEDILAMVYATRIRPHKIVAPLHGPNRVSNAMLKQMNHDLSDVLHTSFIEIKSLKAKVSLYDYSVFVETIFMLYRNVDTYRGIDAEVFKQCFPVFKDDFMSVRIDAEVQINKNLFLICSCYSDVAGMIFRLLSPEETETTSGYVPGCYYNNHVLEVLKPEKETMKIDGHNRLVQKVFALRNNAFEPLTRTPENLGIGGPMKDYPLQVYIQQHVIERLAERLGKTYARFNYLLILPALVTTEPIPAGRSLSYLFPVTLGGIKLGYLMADVMGDKLLIRTFLFLTHNGTPEGKKLQELMGLEKADKKYWGIDQLNTFVLSDIAGDEKLKRLFCEAGCGGLFDINKTIVQHTNQKEIPVAELLTAYLGV